MNRTVFIQHWSSLMNRLMNWFLLGCIIFVFVRPALAADAFFINTGTIDYPLTTNNVPDIDATNFVNLGSFSIDFITVPQSPSLYETHDTLNYTNTGAMESDTGFQFDYANSASNLRTMSATIDNSGTILCASGSGGEIFANEFFAVFGSAGAFEASATNIINPGTIEAGQGGIISISGQNVDLSSGTLFLQGPGSSSAGSGSFGTNVFDPSLLTVSSVQTPILDLLPPPAIQIYTNQVANGSNYINRYVFIQDNSSTNNISHTVYFNTGGEGLGSGDVTIQWAGTFVDPLTGITFTNYLYLNNDYLLGVSTNVLLVNGFPDNFVFTPSTIPLLPTATPTAAAPASFMSGFQPGLMTNFYSYGDISIHAGSAGTNTIANLSLTNFDSRMEIAGSNELNISGAQISGANYISVTAPNQLDDNPGALLEAPYYDLNLGVTNGFLTVSNLLETQNPNFSGTIQVWNTEWLVVSNSFTNDFRVLVVASDFNATTLAQVQNLVLHGTNSIVLSDSFYVMNSAGADSQSLTLTTNGVGVGAASADGELNIQNFNFNWSAGFPNLENLTNSGKIQLQSLGQFISSSNSFTITPPRPETPATATLSEVSGYTNVSANDSVTVGFSQYTFVSKLTNSVPNQIAIGSTFTTSLNNLIAGINHGAGSGTAYSTNTSANPVGTAGLFSTNGFTVTAIVSGPAGDSTPIAATSSALTWGGNTTLMDGANAVPASTNTISSPTWYQNFVNYGLISDQGSSIYSDYFFNSGLITNGINSFALQSMDATFSDSSLFAGGDVSLNAETLLIEDSTIQAGRSLSLQATNSLTDGVAGGPGKVSNGNVWGVGGASSVGLNLPVKPAMGDLLGTTITNFAPGIRKVVNTWAGQDMGASADGFQNNASIGRLILTSDGNGKFIFNGASTGNALYVDDLEFAGQATGLDSNGNPLALTNSANLVIYYAQALSNGVSVAASLNHKNNDHLKWVSSYVGHFSYTNVVINGNTNYYNAALYSDNTLFQFSTNFLISAKTVSQPSSGVQLTWSTLPRATNVVQYTTSLQPPAWSTLTNYNTFYYGAGVAVTNINPDGFASPQASSGPVTNVWVYDSFTNSAQRYYRVVIHQ